MRLGQTIRAIRETQGLSQKEVAEAAGIDQSYLSMIESGQRRNPGMSIMSRLAQALQVSMDELAERAGYLPQPQPPDPLVDRAMWLFRQLPRWRQEDVLAQLELYLRLREQRPRIVGQEEGDEEAEQEAAEQQAA
jgi:transcriptional regulator with XRE-family HTH domain